MLELLTGRHLVGVTRAIKGMPSVADQTAALLAAGVDERHIWQLDRDEVSDVVRAFRPGNDVLVVAFLGVLGKYRHDLLAGIAPKGAALLDLAHGEIEEIGQFPTFNRIKKRVSLIASAPGRVSAFKSGNKPGPKPKDKAFLKRAKALWEGDKGSNQWVADQLGVSITWLYNRFGGRDEAKAARMKRDGI